MNESEGVPPFSLSIPTRSSDTLPVTLQAGDTLFVVGCERNRQVEPYASALPREL